MTNRAEQVFETAIVGAGPIGLEMAVGLRQAGANVVHFEAGQIGSTIQWWAPQTRFFSSPERIEIAGVPLVSVDQSKATRERYLAYLRGIARQFELQINTYSRVSSITRQNDMFELATFPSTHGVGGPAESLDNHSQNAAQRELSRWRAKSVILTIGDMHRPCLLGVPGEERAHVSHFFDDPHRYFNARVLIVGGKNSAVEAALRLHRCGAHVAISYRGEAFDPRRVKYWLRPELEWLISKNRIRFYPRTIVEEIFSDHVALKNIDSSDQQDVAAEFVLLLTGYQQDTTLFEQIGVELQGADRAPRHDRETMQTNVPGVYVAGTAAAGTQSRTKLFIENSHVHTRRIVNAITGKTLTWINDVPQYQSFAES